MAKLYIKNTDGTFIQHPSIAVTNLDIVQSKGDSMTSAMSQKSVTEALKGKQPVLTDTDGSYGQRVAELEKEGIASQEKLTELEQKFNSDGKLKSDNYEGVTLNVSPNLISGEYTNEVITAGGEIVPSNLSVLYKESYEAKAGDTFYRLNKSGITYFAILTKEGKLASREGLVDGDSYTVPYDGIVRFMDQKVNVGNQVISREPVTEYVPFGTEYTFKPNTPFGILKKDIDTLTEKSVSDGYTTIQDLAKHLNLLGKEPVATWVDDDGVFNASNGQHIQSIVFPIVDEFGIKITFAVMNNLGDNVRRVSDNVYMTRGEFLQILQSQGHHVTAHPTHTGWYGNKYDLSKVEPSLVDCLLQLQENHLMHSDMLVYPGESSSIQDVVEIVKKWCVCGVTAGINDANHKGINTKWSIKRTFIDFAVVYRTHKDDVGFVSAIQWYKDLIDRAYLNGDWIIFGTHCYDFTTSEDTSDGNINTLGNLRELISYTINKGIKFRTLWDEYQRRRLLFEFNIK